MPDLLAGVRRASSRLRATPVRASIAHLPRPDARATGIRLRGALVHDRLVALTVAGLVLVASIASVSPAAGVPGSGDADAIGSTPRLVAGGEVLGPGDAIDPAALAALTPALAAEQSDPNAENGATDARFLPDGTLLKPVAVDSAVPDSKGRLADYYVRSGDTLTGIAHRFGISMMTLWWANKLSSKDALHVGQHLVVPPVDGLVVVVKAGDTLESITAGTGVDPQDVADYNGLTDGTVVIGQTLILPGAIGPGIPTPAPTPTPKRTTTTAKRTTSVLSVPSTRYTGGRFSFPLPGHAISQYFHYGHYGIDIAGSTGDAIHAAGAGTVIYAGWRNNGGGLVVWISHGSGLYTTYNHMSAVLVHTGQVVSRGQVVGRVGMTGWATGPHLHFEVWLNGVPGGVDRRVNPLRYF